MSAENHDERIRQEVQRELRWLPEVESPGIVEAVEAGVVTLTGHVADGNLRDAAEQLARRVVGVHWVVNEIQVHKPESDARLDVGLVRAVIEASRPRH